MSNDNSHIIVPAGVKTFETSSSIVWIDEDGIVYSSPKPGDPPEFSRENTKKDMNIFREATGNKKSCILLESNPRSKPPSKDQRDFVSEELNSITKALAIVTTSPVSKMIANLFFGLRPPKYPTKMFTNVSEAREWLKQYL